MLSAGLGASTEPVRLALPGLHRVGLGEGPGDFFTDHLIQELALAGVKVLNLDLMRSMLTPEQQSELLACPENATPCLSELANALGADGVLTGVLGKEGSVWSYRLKAIGKDGTVLAEANGDADGDKEIVDRLAAEAKRMGEELLHELDRVPIKPKVDVARIQESRRIYVEDTLARRYARIPTVAGLACGIGSGVMFALAKGQSDSVAGVGAHDASGLPSLAAARSAASLGSTEQTLGGVLVGVSAVGLGVGLVLYATNRPVVRGALRLVPSGNGLALSGAFP